MQYSPLRYISWNSAFWSSLFSINAIIWSLRRIPSTFLRSRSWFTLLLPVRFSYLSSSTWRFWNFRSVLTSTHFWFSRLWLPSSGIFLHFLSPVFFCIVNCSQLVMTSEQGISFRVHVTTLKNSSIQFQSLLTSYKLLVHFHTVSAAFLWRTCF